MIHRNGGWEAVGKFEYRDCGGKMKVEEFGFVAWKSVYNTGYVRWSEVFVCIQTALRLSEDKTGSIVSLNPSEQRTDRNVFILGFPAAERVL